MGKDVSAEDCLERLWVLQDEELVRCAHLNFKLLLISLITNL